jgi:hypothetical protein
MRRTFFLALAILAAGCDGPELGPAVVDGLDDDFGGASLDAAWKVVNGNTATITATEGNLVIQPKQNVVWYHEAAGPLVYKTVTGNFRVSTVARARKASDPAQFTGNGYQFGGLMARSPASDDPGGQEDHVFNVVGYRGEHLSVETKTTKKDKSFVQGPPWPSGDAELRICRVNGRFHLYKRAVGDTKWEVAVSYKRPDLPATLQVGLIAYSYTDAFDLRASFEKVVFAGVSSEDDCTKD